jgi:hypothetical protein
MLLPALAGILELGLREVAMDQPEQGPVTVGLERDFDGAEIRAGASEPQVNTRRDGGETSTSSPGMK